MDNICSIVREQESQYTNGTTTISKYVDFNMYETINTIDAYINSVHLSGSADAIGREKPFFNIVIAARNIWFRATDIDRKDIKLTSTKSNQVILTLVANILLKNWMKKANFGAFLNDWGRGLATYGSYVVKFVEKDGDLFCNCIPWNRLISDVIDFESNVKIEILEFTPAQLRKKKDYDQEALENLLSATQSRKQIGGQNKDNKDNYIKLYEVHGELPLSLITDKESDDEIYVQQMHVVSFVKGDYDRSARTYAYDDYTLYKGKEKKDPYFITHLIKEDGRALSIGSVENLFQAQWMTNHSMKLQKDVLDLASLMIMQTADGTYAGRNVLEDLITGNILVHADNSPITQVNNQHDITQIVTFGQLWQSQGRELNGISEAMATGEVKAGAAWRQTEALLQESHSLFEVMKENKGLAIEEMLRNYIIPFLKTKMDTSDEITAILEDNDLAQFDSMYVPNEAIRRDNKQVIDTVLSGQVAQNMDRNMLEQDVRQELSTLGNQRYIRPSDIPDKTWKELMKDFEWEPDINIKDEAMDTQAVLTTLSTTLQTIARNPMVLQDPTAKTLFNKILETTGQISPVEIPVSKPQLQMSPAMVAAGQKTPTQ